MALTKVFRIELTGGKDVEKDIKSISKAMGAMAASIVKAKTELAQLVSSKADPAAISALTKKITELEAKFKSLSAQRKQAETDAKRQAEAEKILADAKLKEAQASKAQAQADRERIKSQIDQEKEIDRQIDREKKEEAELQKKKRILDGLPGSYNAIKKALSELKPFINSGGLGGTIEFNGQQLNFEQAFKEFERLTKAEQDWRRQFAKDGTLVGEYASGIVDAFKKLNIDDIIKDQVTGAKNQLGELEKKTTELTVAYREAQKQGSQDLDKLQKEIHDNVVETEALRKKVQEAEVQLGGVGAVGNQITSSLRENFKDLKNSVGQFIVGYIGFQGVLSGLQTGTDNAKTLSDQTTDLEIQLNKAKGGASGLVTELSKLNTRTKLTVLEDIANIASKAGATEQNLLGVSRGIDVVKTAFGKDFGEIEAGTETFVKLINIFYDDGQVTEDRILKIGNSIRTLANETVASVPFINDFAGRMAGLRQVSNVSLPQIIGLGAGFEEFKQSAEVSSTVLVKVIPQMAKDIDTFAKITGKTREEFKKLLQDNPVEALLQVSQGLAAGKGDIEVFSKSLSEAGIDAGRAISIISTLGGKADIFRDRISRAGTAIESTDAITDAFNRKNENLAATMDKISKKFSDAAGSKAFQTTLLAISSAITLLLNNLGIIITLVGVYSAIWAVANGTMIQTRIVTFAANLAFKAQYAWLVITETATKAFAVANTFLSSSLLRAATSSTILTTAIKILSGPLGIILTILGLLTLSVTAFSKTVAIATGRLREQYLAQKLYNEIAAEARNNISETVAKESTYLAILKDKNVGLDTQKKALADLIALNPQYLNGLTLQNLKMQEGQSIIDNYNRALLLKAEREAAGARKAKEFQELTRLQGIKIQLESLTAGGRSVKASDITGELEEYYKGVLGAQGKINLAIRKTFGADAMKDNIDLVLAELNKGIKKQSEIVNAADTVVTEIVDRDDRFNKALLFKNFTRIQGQVKVLRATLSGLKEGSAEYLKVQQDLVLKEKELEDARNAALGKTDSKTEPSATGVKQSQTLEDLYKQLKEVNSQIAEVDKIKNKSDEEIKKLKDLRKKRTEIIREIKELGGSVSGSGGSKRSPEKQKLDDALKDIDAAMAERRNALDEQFNQGLISERDYYSRVRDITVDGEQQKIDTIQDYQTRYKKALAKYHGELAKETSEAEKKQIQAKRDANQKLFEVDSKQLDINLRNEQNAAGRDRDTTLLNPNLSNEDQVQATLDYYDRLLLAQVVYNQKQIELEKKYGIKSVENAQKRKEEIEKIRKEIEASEQQRQEARQKDIQATADAQLDEIRKRAAERTIAILESNQSYTKKARELAKVERDLTKEQLANEVAAAKISLDQAEKDKEKRLISEKEYQKKLADYKEKEAALYKVTTDAQVSATRRFINALKELKDSFVENALGIKKYSDDAQGEQQRAQDAVGTAQGIIEQAVTSAYESYFQNQSDKIEKDKQEHLDALDREKERVLARAQSEKEKEAIERQYEKKKKETEKKAAEEQRQLALKKATIDFAIAVIKTFAQFGFPLGLIPVAALTGAYLLQRAQINKQQFALGGTLKKKEYGFGGNADVPVNGGVFGGKSHSQGGTDFEFGGNKYNAEANELSIIRTRNAPATGVYSITGNQKQIASALNAIGGGVNFSAGAKVSKFSTGGYLGSSLKAPYFNAGAYLSGGSVGSKVDDDRIERLEAMTEHVLEAVYATDIKPVILQPGKVTEAQKKKKKDVSTGTI